MFFAGANAKFAVRDRKPTHKATTHDLLPHNINSDIVAVRFGKEFDDKCVAVHTFVREVCREKESVGFVCSHGQSVLLLALQGT